MKKNTGVIIKNPSATDYIAGAETGITYNIVLDSGNWTQYLPSEERQSNKIFDTMACVSFSALNVLETLFNYMLSTSSLTAKQEMFLKNEGYIAEDGKVNFSDRFTAKVSGTTKKGNSLANVWDSIRNIGVIPEEDWVFTDTFDWNAYYADVPQDFLDKAKDFTEMFDIKYEWVPSTLENLKKHAKQAPLQVVGKVCIPWDVSTIIPACGVAADHATMLYNVEFNDYDIFDHYAPFEKRLALDYPLPYVIKGIISQSPPPPLTTFKHKFTIKIEQGQTSNEVKALQTALKLDGVFPANVNITGFYGTITKKAVLDFQKKYKLASLADILYIKGRWVGPLTRVKLNQLFS
jgi:hypothetical protein